jgi:PAS domain S-box-containing protein
MPTAQTEPATIVVDSDGKFLEASPAALAILGVSLSELLDSEPGAFAVAPRDVEGSAAFREIWEAEGRPDITGETTIMRPDGERRRVRFVITPRADGRLAAVIEPVATEDHGPAIVYTAGQALAEWRAAERRLEAVPQDSPEWRLFQAQVESLRAQYHRLFDARRG